MNRSLVAFFVGLIFAIGLGIAGMTKPSKVLNFLDIAGTWDPSLAFVMVGAISIYALTYRLSRSLARPVLDRRFVLPTKTKVEAPLLLGAAMFGVGWGIAGFCPGPMFVALGSGLTAVALFFVAFSVGALVVRK